MAGHAVLRPGGSCLKCPVRVKGLCTPLPTDQIGFLEHLVSGIHLYPAGSDLFRQDEACTNFFTVREGWAFTYVLLEHGNRQILDFALPGAFLGVQADPALPMTYSAQCLTSVRVCIYPKPDVYEVLRRESRFALQLCEIEACQQARLNDHLANIGQRDAFARVTHLIVELFFRMHDRLPAKTGEVIEFPLRLMHISDALGITREHASRTLRALREQGICDARGRALRILNPSSLLQLSGLQHDPRYLLTTPRHA